MKKEVKAKPSLTCAARRNGHQLCNNLFMSLSRGWEIYWVFFHFVFLANYVYVFESNFVLVSIPQSAGVNEIPSEFVGPWQPLAIVFTPTGFMWWKYPKTLSLHLSQLYYSVIWGYLYLRTWKTLYCSIIRLLVKPQLSYVEAWSYAYAPRTKSNYQLLYGQQGKASARNCVKGHMGHSRD